MNKRKILALGFFDGVHRGHSALLKACRGLADSLGVTAGAVTFDIHPMSLTKGRSPLLINTPADRDALMQEQGIHEIVTLAFDEQLRCLNWQDFLRLLMEKHGAAGFVCGSDFRFGYLGEGSAMCLLQFAKAHDLPCVIVPRLSLGSTVISSSHIRSLLKDGSMEEANRFLGHPHRLTGKVIPGQHLGRTLGTPTANLAFPDTLAIPRFGVYACLAHVEGKTYAAVTNVGTRPTVDGRTVTIEPWLIKFDGDLYGKEILLEFYSFLRPERKFESLEELKAEIHPNALQTWQYFHIHGLLP